MVTFHCDVVAINILMKAFAPEQNGIKLLFELHIVDFTVSECF